MTETLTTGTVMSPMHEEPPGVPLIDIWRSCLGLKNT